MDMGPFSETQLNPFHHFYSLPNATQPKPTHNGTWLYQSHVLVSPNPTHYFPKISDPTQPNPTQSMSMSIVQVTSPNQDQWQTLPLTPHEQMQFLDLCFILHKVPFIY
jgi:hypothetical protein